MDNKKSLSKSDEFRDLLADYIHGASELVRRLFTQIAHASGSSDTVLKDLGQARELLRRAHPEMVSLSMAVTLILKRVEKGADVETASRELELSWNANMKRVTEMAAKYLAGHHRVLTISYSGLVRDAILKAKAQSCTPEVYLGEGRPKYEGLALARELADEGVPCTVFADSAFAGFINDVDCVLIGADAICASFLLNKIGTTAILREARARDVPTAVAYDCLKVTEDAEFSDLIMDYPADELLMGPSAQRAFGSNAGSSQCSSCLQVVNRYFETIPRSLLDVELADSF